MFRFSAVSLISPMLSLPPVLTHVQAGEVSRSLRAKVAVDLAPLVLEAGALKEFDSSALAVILACRREALTAGKTFSVRDLPARLGQLAGLYGVAELIQATV